MKVGHVFPVSILLPTCGCSWMCVCNIYIPMQWKFFCVWAGLFSANTTMAFSLFLFLVVVQSLTKLGRFWHFKNVGVFFSTFPPNLLLRNNFGWKVSWHSVTQNVFFGVRTVKVGVPCMWRLMLADPFPPCFSTGRPALGLREALLACDCWSGALTGQLRRFLDSNYHISQIQWKRMLAL